MHPVEISGALQQPTCALVENAKRCYMLSTTAHKLSSTVSCNDCTQLTMLPLNGWRQTAPPGFCNRREWGMSRGSRVWSPPEADTFTAVHREFVGFGICRVIRRSSTTMKAHTYYIIFGHPPIRGEASPPSGGATDKCTRQQQHLSKQCQGRLQLHTVYMLHAQ